MNNEYCRISSPSTEISRSRMRQDDNVSKGYTEMVDYLASTAKHIPMEYDILFDGDGSMLLYSRIFKDHLLIQSSSLSLNLTILGRIVKGDRTFLTPATPKYSQLPYRAPSRSTAVCFLCGSNLFPTLRRKAVRHCVDTGVVLKLHPITSQLDIAKMKDASDLPVIPGWVDAYDTLNYFDIVHSPPSSEMGLIARLLGKEVIELPLDGMHSYTPFYKHIAKLPLIISSAKSGIIRPTHYREDIDTYLKHYNECLVNMPPAPPL